jgi:hypothetical protein
MYGTTIRSKLVEMPLPRVARYAPSDGMSTAQEMRADPIVRADDAGKADA